MGKKSPYINMNCVIHMLLVVMYSLITLINLGV